MSTTPTTPRKRRRWVTPVAVAAAVLAGVGVGAASSGTTVTTSTPAPTTTVTAEPQTITETEHVEVTPQSCITALGHADALNGAAADLADLTAQYIGLIPRAAEAGASYDARELDAITTDMQSLTGQVTDLTDVVTTERAGLDAAALECRAGAR